MRNLSFLQLDLRSKTHRRSFHLMLWSVAVCAISMKALALQLEESDLHEGLKRIPALDFASQRNHWGATTRQLLVLQNSATKATAIFPRRDPLNKLKIYEGGFNMKDEHYWSSVAFTGIWAFAMAFVCFLVGTVASIRWLCYKDVSTKIASPDHTDDVLRGLHFFCVFQFSILAIMSAGVVFWGIQQTRREVKESTNVIVSNVDQAVNQVDFTISIIENATAPLLSASLVDTVQAACDKLNTTATLLGSNFSAGKAKFYETFDHLKVLLIVTTAMIPSVVLVGLVAILKVWCRLLRMAFAMMTIIIFASWALCGIAFILSNVTSDTCQAMKEYERNSQNSSFAKILPCLRTQEATDELNTAKLAIKNLISQTNSAIDMVNEREGMMPESSNMSYNITLKHFCDPYGPPPDYEDAKCSENQSNFTTYETDYIQYRCNEDVVRHCFENNTPIPSTYYSQFIISMTAAKDVYKILPSLFNIMTCTFIRVAFQDLTANHCSSLQSAFNTIWISFAGASVSMVSLQIMWLAIRKYMTGNTKIDLHSFCSPFGVA